MTDQPDRGVAESFLAALDPAAAKFTFQVFDDHKKRAVAFKRKYGQGDPYRTAIIHGSLEKCWSDLVTFSARGCGVFVCINATDLKGRSAANVERIRAAFVDIDEGGPLPTFHCPPHIIVESSPSKWHVYWLVSDCGLDQFEGLQKRLLRHYGGDPKITDRSRVLRLPGFPHQKTDLSFLTRLVEAHDHDRYTVETLVNRLPGVSETEQDDDWSEQDESKTGPKAWTPAEEAKLRSALAAIPTDEDVLNERFGDSHKVWINVGRALERLGWKKRGYAIWRDWSRGNADKFDEGGLRTNWLSFGRTRDGAGKKVTVGTIYHYARAFGWKATPAEEPAAVEPTYPDQARTSVDAARAELERLIEAFFDYEPNVWERLSGMTRAVHAVQASTGIGKTRIAARVIARRINSGQLAPPVGYAVPTHRLGEDVADLFRAEGISAEVWRGRKALGKDGDPMCDDLGAVKIAEDMGAVIETACCKGKDPEKRKVTCPHYSSCAYQAQKNREPDVWIFAHQMLFQKNKTLDEMSALFIDESFRDAGTSKPVRGLTLDEIDAVDFVGSDLWAHRRRLSAAVRAQPKNGGVPRKNLVDAGLDADACTRAIQLEWIGKGKSPLWPGMPAKARAEAAKAGANIRHIRAFDRVWRAARELLKLEDDVISGRLFLANHKTENGVVRVVQTRSIREVAKQYVVPTFIMDATLPAKSILKKWFPDVQVVGEIEVPMPYVHVRQVLGAPITKKKLGGAGRNLRAVRRYVLQRHVEAGRGPVLVIAQKDIEAALRATGLPPPVAVEHFNAIGGLDQYRSVRLLITVGRTQPEPAAVEADAGALSGVEPVKAAVRANQSIWFDRVTRGLRLRDGSGLSVVCDQHPDPLAEDVRQQICEGELVQAIGRGRGVNRAPETPLDIDVMADVVLPVTVDQVDDWRPPGLEVEMVAEGVWLESPADMSKAWPDDWPTPQAAKDWLNRKMVVFPLIEHSYQGKVYHLRYQPAGVKQRWRTAWVDPAVVPDPRLWLETRLGPLAGYEVVTICFTLRADTFTVGGLDFATPTVTVRPGSGQERFPWSTPVVEEIFPTPEEVTALWKLPAVIEGADRFPWPTPKALEPFHVEGGVRGVLGTAAGRRGPPLLPS
jgi:hypothetical protein